MCTGCGGVGGGAWIRGLKLLVYAAFDCMCVQVVAGWEAEPEYPKRYTLYALFYSLDALEAKFFEVRDSKFTSGLRPHTQVA